MTATHAPGICSAGLYKENGYPNREAMRAVGFRLARIDAGKRVDELFAIIDEIERGLTREQVPYVYRMLRSGINPNRNGDPALFRAFRDNEDLPSMLVRLLMRGFGWEFARVVIGENHEGRPRLEARIDALEMVFVHVRPRLEYHRLRAGDEVLVPTNPDDGYAKTTHMYRKGHTGETGWLMTLIPTGS